MKTILIISAHPSSAGFTHQAVAQVKVAKEAAGHMVEVVDLYTESPLSFLKFESKDDIVTNDTIKKYQNQVRCADEVFSYTLAGGVIAHQSCATGLIWYSPKDLPSNTVSDAPLVYCKEKIVLSS